MCLLEILIGCREDRDDSGNAASLFIGTNRSATGERGNYGSRRETHERAAAAADSVDHLHLVAIHLRFVCADDRRQLIVCVQAPKNRVSSQYLDRSASSLRQRIPYCKRNKEKRVSPLVACGVQQRVTTICKADPLRNCLTASTPYTYEHCRVSL